MIGTQSNSNLSLVALYEISKMLSASLDLERTLLDVLNLLATCLPFRRGTVAVRDCEGRLTVLAAAGLSPLAVRNGAAQLPLAVAQGVISSEMPFVIQDVTEEPLVADRVHLFELDEDERVALMGIPLRTKGKPFGVLMVDRLWGGQDQAKANFEADVRFLMMVANLVSQTIKLNEKVASDRQRLLDEKESLQRQEQAARGRSGGKRWALDEITGDSKPMQELFAQIHQAAPTRSTVMIRGESGTGKELIARAIHTLSKVKDGPFIKVNCAALPESLLESELFGHEKGAFTGATSERKGRFELAHNGTLFLDEIGEISLPFQAKLLRVLQEGEFERVGGMKTLKVRVRLICATNRNLEEAVAQGKFRGDLYYRINVVPVFVPALRERREDIPVLADLFLQRFNQENERALAFSGRAMGILSTCKFPGNVRELENCVSRAATMTRGEKIDDVAFACQTGHCLSRVLWLPTKAAAVPAALEMAEPDPGEELLADDCADAGDEHGDLPQRERLIRAMEKAGWVQAKAARLLDLTPRQLGYALRKYNIEIKRL
jgi:Nif-specific regulatory protein